MWTPPVHIRLSHRLAVAISSVAVIAVPEARAAEPLAACGPSDAPLVVASPRAPAQAFVLARRSRLDRLAVPLSATSGASVSVALSRVVDGAPDDEVVARRTVPLAPGPPTEQTVAWPDGPVLDAGVYAVVVEPPDAGQVAWSRCPASSAADAYVRATNGRWVALPATALAFRLDGAPVDERPPETTITSAPPPISNVLAPTFTFTADEPARFLCVLDDGSPFACASPLRLDVPTDGPHRLTVRATDAVGNVDPSPAVAAFTLDRRAPAVVVERLPADAAGPVLVAFAADEAADVLCALDDADAVPCTSPWPVVLDDDAAHRVRVVARDRAGNEGAADLTVTRSGRLALAVRPGRDGSRETTVSWPTTEGRAYRCTLDDGPAEPCESPLVVRPVREGRHRLEVEALDGDVVSDRAETTFVSDWTPPELVVPRGIEVSGADGAVATWTVIAADAWAGTVEVTCSPPSGSRFPTGTTAVTCRAVDDLGNARTATFTVTVTETPVAAPVMARGGSAATPARVAAGVSWRRR